MKQEDELRVPAAMAMAMAHRRRLLLGDPFSVDGRGSSEEIFHADGHRHGLRDGLFNGYGDVDRDGNGSSYEIFNGDADRNRSRNEIFTGDGDRIRSRNDIFNRDEGGKGNRRRYEIFNGDGDGDRDGCGNGNGSSRNEIFNGNGDGIGNGNGSSNEIFNRNGIGDRSKDEIFDAIGNGNRNRNEILNGNGNGDGDRRNEIFNGNGIGNGNRNKSSNDIFNGNGNRNGILDENGDGTGNRSKNKNGNGHGNGSGSVECPRCESKNTKFCYYNNYNLCQPRHFCKACKRYWTKGGTLRNVPVGGGCRKNNYPSKNARNTEKSSPANLPQPPPRFLDLLTLPDHTLLTHCHSLNGPPRPADSVESPYLLPSSDTFPKQEVLDSTLGTTRDECRAASDGNETIGAYNTTMLDIGKSAKPISSPLQWSMQQHQRVPLPLMTMTNDMQHQRFPLPLMTATNDGGPPLMENNNIPTPSYTNNCHLPFKRSVLMMMQDGNMRDEEQEKKKKAMPPPPDESVTFLDWQVLPPAAVASSSSSQGFFEDPWNDLSHYGYGQGPFT